MGGGGVRVLESYRSLGCNGGVESNKRVWGCNGGSWILTRGDLGSNSGVLESNKGGSWDLTAGSGV